jgi:hypothetical protein
MLTEALAALPAPYREVIVLVDLLDFSVERTAWQLGIGERAAKSRLHRARRALAALLGQPEVRRSHERPGAAWRARRRGRGRDGRWRVPRRTGGLRRGL